MLFVLRILLAFYSTFEDSGHTVMVFCLFSPLYKVSLENFALILSERYFGLSFRMPFICLFLELFLTLKVPFGKHVRFLCRLTMRSVQESNRGFLSVSHFFFAFVPRFGTC